MRKLLHFKPKKNWMNDPNGLVYYKGKYHMFYQCFPYSNEWGTMHWGHATTTDFFNWDDHDIALYPSIEADQNGCFSGSALATENGIEFYYTGVRYLSPDKNNIHIADDKEFISKQIQISSKDGYEFDNKNGKKVVIDMIDDPDIGHAVHTRDPKVWLKNENKYAIVGTKRKTKTDFEGGILVYKEVDSNFQLIDTVYNNEIGNMWECPDYFEIDDSSYIVMSPEQITLDGENYTNNAIITPAKFDYNLEKLVIDYDYQYLDFGLDLYAPQSFLDENGRRIMFGWLRMYKSFDGHSLGMMTMPRVLSVENGLLKYSVHELVKSKFINDISSYNDKPICIETSILVGQKINICGLKIQKEDNELIIDRSELHSDIAGISNIAKLKIYGDIKLEVYVDENVFEIFVNDGISVCTLVVEKLKRDFRITNDYTIKEMSDE